MSILIFPSLPESLLKSKFICLFIYLFIYLFIRLCAAVFCTCGQSGLVNLTISVNGANCKVPAKRISVELEDKSVFSAVVELRNQEIVLNKVNMVTLDVRPKKVLECHNSESTRVPSTGPGFDSRTRRPCVEFVVSCSVPRGICTGTPISSSH